MEAAEERKSFRGRGGNRGRSPFRGRGGDGMSRGRGGDRGRSPFRGRGGDRGRSPFRGHRGGDRPFRGRGGDRGRSPFRGHRGGDGTFRGRGGDRGRSPFRGHRGGDGTFQGRGGDRGRSPFRGRGRSPFRGHREGGEGSFRGRGGRGGFRGRGENSNKFSKKTNEMQQGDSSENEEDAISGSPSTKPSGQEKKNRNKTSRPVELVTKHHLVPEETKKTICIANLPKKVESMHQDFQDFIIGAVGPVKLLFYTKTPFPKSAVVTAVCVFESPSDFNLALETLNGKVFCDHHLIVRKFKDSNSNAQLISKNCILVTDLSKAIVEEDLWKLFESCGKLGVIFINYHRPGDKIEALVNFQSHKDVVKALKLDGSVLGDSTIKVMHLDLDRSIVVSKLLKSVSSKVFELFLNGRNATYFRVEPRGTCQKTAFVTFSDKESYQKALTLNGTEIKGGAIEVSPAATSKMFLNGIVKGEVPEDEAEENEEDEGEEESGEEAGDEESGEEVEDEESGEEVEDEESGEEAGDEESGEEVGDEESGEEVEGEVSGEEVEGEESGEEVEGEESGEEVEGEVSGEEVEDEESGEEVEDEESGEEVESEEDKDQNGQESDESMIEVKAKKDFISLKTNKPKQQINPGVYKVQPPSQNNKKRKRNNSGRGFSKFPKRN